MIVVAVVHFYDLHYHCVPGNPSWRCAVWVGKLDDAVPKKKTMGALRLMTKLLSVALECL